MAGGFSEDWYRDHQKRVAGMRPATRVVDRDAAPATTDLGPDYATAFARNPVLTSAPGGAEKPGTKCKRRPEQDLQKQVASYLRWALPTDFRFHHSPNETGTRAAWEGMLLKALGVSAGFPDLIILTPTARFIAIELKSNTGSLSRPQREWRDWCRAIGAPWFLCRSLDDVIEALESLQISLRVKA
jgi:hypothetical protein